ncbi:MAG TPA: hypothetical protein VJ921_10610 [Vicinamibacteria bacterium]|nr:hypothetical protein [Vicinamibacteria bacterium]
MQRAVALTTQEEHMSMAENLPENMRENLPEAHEDGPDVEGHGFGGVVENFAENLTENLTENKME